MPSFLRPRDLEALQFNQLRSKNLIIAPWNIAQAGQRQLEGAPQLAMMLPGAMGQNKWKTPPAGFDRNYAASARAIGVLAPRFSTKAPPQMMQPIPFYQPARAVQHLNTMPRQDLHVNVVQPISRGILQRGGVDFTNAPDLRAVVRRRQDPPTAYGVQDNIASQMFPSTYVFNRHERPHFVEGPRQGVGLGGIPGAPRVIAPLYGASRHQPLIIYTDRTQNWRR